MTNKALAAAGGMFSVSLLGAATSGDLGLWSGAALFGLMLVACLVIRLRPPAIEIDQDGVQVIGPFGGRRSYPFSSCGEFAVVRQTVAQRQQIYWLVFDDAGKRPRAWFQRANSAILGGDSQFRVDGFDHSPEQIAGLMNRYRTAARSSIDPTRSPDVR